MTSLTEIQSVKQWNETLRSSTAAGMTVIVDFHAEWCAPCKAIAPRYASLASRYPQARFLRVDVDRQKAIAAKYEISAMPTFLAIKAGKVVDSLRGVDPQGLDRLVASHAGPNPPVAPLPEAAEAAKVAGNASFQQKKYSDALAKYSEAISLAPTSAQLYGNRSITYLRMDPPSPDLALADAQKATELEPKWGKGWVRLGEALQTLDRGEESIKAFEKGVEASEGLVKTEAKKKLEDAKKKLGWH